MRKMRIYDRDARCGEASPFMNHHDDAGADYCAIMIGMGSDSGNANDSTYDTHDDDY